MHALLLATSFPRDADDWRGRFIFDQAAALARQGVALRLWAPPGELPAGVTSALSGDDASWLSDLLDHGGIAHLLRKRPWAGVWAAWGLLRRLHAAFLREARRSPGADFYLINWLQNALALPDDGRPAVVTVLGSDLQLLRVPGMVSALRRRFRGRQTLLSPNANWSVARLQELFGGVAHIEANPFGVAPEWFDIERTVERCGWLVVTRVTRGKLGHLLEWGDGLFSAERPLDLLGPMQEDVSFPLWIRHHGATNPLELRERWFPRAAGLLTLSQHAEGRPQVMIEAMAAGLPVIASDIAAHADLIRHGQTGWLVGGRSELADALSKANDGIVAANVGAAARAFVVDRIGAWDDCARRYVNSFRSLYAGRT